MIHLLPRLVAATVASPSRVGASPRVPATRRTVSRLPFFKNPRWEGWFLRCGNEIGDEVPNFTARDRDGKTVFEIKHPDEEKIVALKRQSGQTEIDLAHILHGTSQPN